MKLYFSPSSPFVRKVLLCAYELGLGDKIELLPSAAGPVQRDRKIVADNPLGQVPTFFTDEGVALYDSRVICEYLDHLAGGTLFPVAGPARWSALVEQSVGDGILDAALLARYEDVARPATLHWADWRAGQLSKATDALDLLERNVAALEGRIDIGTITLACAMSYLDLRFPSFGWRDGRDALSAWYAQFAARPSMIQTALR